VPRWPSTHYQEANDAQVKGTGMSWLAVILGVILVLAFLVRVIDLDHIPYVFGGDEGSQAMSAVAVLNGLTKNPFGTGWSSVPNLFFFLQAGSLWVVGDSVAGPA
jgi:hypothetical protein